MLDNELAVRHCREYLLSLEISGGEAYLENIQVFSKEQWLVSLWDNSFPAKQVLRPVQLLALAEKVLSDSGVMPDQVLNPQRIAKRFVQAFEQAAAYDIDTEAFNSLFIGAETQAFMRWREALQARLDELQALAPAQLPNELMASLADLELPEQIVCSPEIQWSAAEQRFIAASSAHSEWLLWQSAEAKLGAAMICAEHWDQECAAAADWAARHYREQVPSRSGAAGLSQIGIALANYSDDAAADVTAALQQALYPQYHMPALLEGEELLQEPWLLPRAGRLYEHPLIAVALDVMRLGLGDCEADCLSRVLLSPYVSPLAKPSEAEQDDTAAGDTSATWILAKLDRQLREQFPAELSLKQVLAEVAVPVGDLDLEGLQRLQHAIEDLPSRQSPSAWVRSFDHMLAIIGWPNVQGANSDIAEASNVSETVNAAEPVNAGTEDYIAQCLRGFSQVMDVFRGLDRPLGDIGLSTAIRWLDLIVREKRFQLRRPPARLQVLSLEDAREQLFDHLWIMDLNETALPRAPELAAFLPRDVLRAAAVPRVDAEDCLRRDRALLHTVIQGCADVVCSYARERADGLEQAASPLLSWQQAEAASSGEPPLAFQLQTERPREDSVPALTEEERQQLRGGTGLFRHMALSPFIAFCRYRLKLRDFPQRIEGLDPATQGQWLHAVLEQLWRQLGSSEGLAALNDEQLRSRVDSLCEQSVRSRDYSPALLAVERQRIAALVMDWLAYERGRSEPFTVEAVEQAEAIEIAGLPLRLRADRIDVVNGKRVVVDYKTGRIQGKKLNASELQEPQLPIYALYTERGRAGEIDGVALAQIHSDGIAEHMRSSWTAGLAAKRSRQESVDTPEKWQAECEAWDRQIQALASAFKAGDIRHDYDAGDDALRFDEQLLPLSREAEQ